MICIQPETRQIHPENLSLVFSDDFCYEAAFTISAPAQPAPGIVSRSSRPDNHDNEVIRMGLKIIVTVKQVPDTHNITGEAMKEDGTVNRAALPTIFNPEDLNALEEALQIKEAVGGTVTCISMGPPNAVEVLKECLFRGADDVILVSDRRFAGADTLATSYALKCAIEPRQKSMISCSLVSIASSRRVTKAQGVSPHFSSGIAATAASRTAG
jgi:hypothetical protein